MQAHSTAYCNTDLVSAAALGGGSFELNDSTSSRAGLLLRHTIGKARRCLNARRRDVETA
jgi:hypothetical protein